MASRATQIAILAAGAAALAAQQQTLTFDAASVKLNNSVPGGGRSGPDGGIVRLSPGKLSGRRATVGKLIQTAYHVSAYQISGGPSWIESDTFDIEAKAETTDKNQLRQMLQSLLSERFKLAFHRIDKEMSVYTMTLRKNGPGPNLHPMKDGEKVPEIQTAKPTWGSNEGIQGPTVIFTGDTMEEFALIFSGPNYNIGRPVIDKTGLPGIFYGYLHWAMDGDPVPAIQEQLGFRFESQKLPVSVLVIDRVEKPDAN
jgi:uncharacterized protein (TIGR03435 family)